MLKNKLIGAVLLITGTVLGAGMLALPISTGEAGFWVASLTFIFMWVLSSYLGLLVLEANMRLDECGNLISMTRQTLGKPGEMVAWACCILFLYALLIAYLSGMGAMITHGLSQARQQEVPHAVGPTLVLIVFLLCNLRGKRLADYLNRALVIGIFLAYLLLIVTISPHVSVYTLNANGLHSPLHAIPIIFTAFGYMIVIPSIRQYLGSHIVSIKQAIFIGSGIALVVYLIWELLILGVIPGQGPVSLSSILHHGNTTVELTQTLSQLTQNNHLTQAVQLFMFCALATSFIGVSMSVLDFLADALAIGNTLGGRLLLLALTFGPPYYLSLRSSTLFIQALTYAGIFCLLLHAILPVLMVWRGRYQLQLSSGYQAPGGKLSLMTVLLLSSAAILLQFV